MAYSHQMTDIQLEDWQRKQLDRCRLENAINKLIETYGVHEESSDVRLYNVDSQNLEESAILMAISEHGLHQNDRFRLEMPPESERSTEQRPPYYNLCGSSRSTTEGSTSTGDDRSNATSAHSDESNSTSNDTNNILEAAVSVAIQKQGLGLSGLNR